METGEHFVFECPVNEGLRKEFINGAQTRRDLEEGRDKGWE